ncbi:MAG: acylneuraminate cytidylyltransferase family protein [Rhodospirillaceae bacterium]|nr:acylneuraminate cytidylyltransferase family protein [Rhodospirillaceae bacterium]MBT5240803.1 acylneuraminate cytidylyltransferase family protein [Rhodospirillaceae bacterium]MBT5564727.1 acylneuraminate cytidylyltransferase family protein [Rhodospirillaceae bacterium]MBT6090140.1 acylneuraminate cytidylyltransferase family protein [Rhodospirillaceae bacterium]MBT6961136.1 acylneuraminate cytidylyltransferase family protein [Rhodospirillaceae bacterium]
MATPPDILFLIAARGGSKGLPGKNLKPVSGLSLVGYKARAAQRCQARSRLILSTDSEDIAAEGRRLGVEVPFTRPSDLATDAATSDSVVAHAMDWIEETEKRTYDAVMLLEPASPFATAAHLENAIALYTERDADLVVGLRQLDTYATLTGDFSPDGSIASIVEQMHETDGLRRQDLQPQVTMNGAFYLISWSAFRHTKKIYGDPARCYGLVMDRWHSLEIETAEDLALAEYAAAKGLIDLTPWHDAGANP